MLSSKPNYQPFFGSQLVLGCLVALVSLGQILVNPVLAQAQTLDQDPASQNVFELNLLKTDYVWTKTDLTAEVIKQRQIYHDQLEQYRQQEKNFLIAQDQYRQHATLDSIEQAVQATKRMLLSRDQVLHTYLTLLQLRLLAAEGVELSLKDREVVELEALREKLKLHHAAVSDQVDRPLVNKSADEFLIIGEAAQLVSSQTLGLLGISKLQEIYDKANALFPDITTEVTVVAEGETTSPQTTRSLKETTLAMAKSQTNLVAVWNKVAERINSGSDLSGQTDFSRDLNDSYVGLSKTLNYFLELLKLFRSDGAAAA